MYNISYLPTTHILSEEVCKELISHNVEPIKNGTILYWQDEDDVVNGIFEDMMSEYVWNRDDKYFGLILKNNDTGETIGFVSGIRHKNVFDVNMSLYKNVKGNRDYLYDDTQVLLQNKFFIDNGIEIIKNKIPYKSAYLAFWRRRPHTKIIHNYVDRWKQQRIMKMRIYA